MPVTRHPKDPSRDHLPRAAALVRACRRVVLAGLLVLLAVSGAIARWGSVGQGARFAAGAGATWWLVSRILWSFATDEMAPRSGATGHAGRSPAAGATLGLATHLTLLRGLLASVLAGIVLSPRPEGTVSRFLPGLVYLGAALSDRYDGIVARRRGQVTELGRRLDGAMDGLGLFVASLLTVRWHRLPPWYLSVGCAYYVFHAGLFVRRRLGWPVDLTRLRARRWTRFFAGVQMGVCVAALLPETLLSFLPSPWPSRLMSVAPTLLMLPTLAFFVRDWRLVVAPRAR